MNDPTRASLVWERDRLARAKRLYQEGNLAESEALFRELVQSSQSDLRGQAVAGVGMIRLRLGDVGEANKLFQLALKQGANADAHYGLGVLAEQQRALDDARYHFQQALSVNATHEGAAKGLRALGYTAASQPAPIPSRPPERESAPIPASVPSERPTIHPDRARDQAAFYQILSADRNPISQEALRLIDSLEGARTPRPTSYLLSRLFVVLGLVWVPLLVFGLSAGPTTLSWSAATGTVIHYSAIIGQYSLTLAIPVLGCWVAALVRVIQIRRISYVFSGGWLTVNHGVLSTTEKPFELTHLVETEITRGPLDQLTGNGKLKLTFTKHGAVVLLGLAPIGTLRNYRATLNDLSRLLRSNPILKGLIA